MAVVTILRELGSGGGEIGQAVAQRLGYDFVDRQVIEGIFRQYGLTKFDHLYSTMPSFLDLIDHTNLVIVAMLNEIMEALAQRGNAVILGRGAFAVLGDCTDVLDVHLHAPAAVRAQRVLAREQLADLPQAEAHIAEDDKMRRRFVHMFYNKTWDDDAQFDLVLDTSTLSLEEAVEQIVAAAQALAASQPAPDARTTAKLNVDPVLADAVVKALANPLPALQTP